MKLTKNIMKNRIIYYADEINDDFAGTNIKTSLTPENFKYIHTNPVYKTIEYILYHAIARPLVWIMTKHKYHQKFVNKSLLKKYKKQGYFIYGNHTMTMGDAFIPNISASKKNYIVTGPDATSIKGLRTIVTMLGAIPLPSTIHGTKQFKNAISLLIRTNHSVTIYPEAHIWPYYTHIRPFPSGSFRYPVDENAPCFVFTNVFVKSKNRLRKTPKVITYIDGPFYPNTSLFRKNAIEDLRNRVYEKMVERSNLSTIEYIKYVKKED